MPYRLVRVEVDYNSAVTGWFRVAYSADTGWLGGLQCHTGWLGWITVQLQVGWWGRLLLALGDTGNHLRVASRIINTSVI